MISFTLWDMVRHLLTGAGWTILLSVIAFVLGAGSILDALSINDQKARFFFAPLFASDLSNQIFLKRTPVR